MQVKMNNLTMKFKDVVAVDNISITIPSGKLIGLLGPSGCGKSTTLYMICGLYKPTNGQIFFGDDNVTNLPPEKRGIGLVFQNYALYPHMTVRQNIMFPLENQRVPRKEALERAAKAAALVQIEPFLDRKPGQLSGGQQQRVAIARAMVKNPQVLLLDEPLSNLDARLRLQTREEIKRIQQETGVTTIFVTHDQEEAMSISDEIIVMKEGVIHQIGHPQDVYRRPTNLFVAKFLGNPPINILEGSVKDGDVVIGGIVFGKLNYKVPNGDYYIGVRPEHMRVDPNGVEVSIIFYEQIGRDTSIRFKVGKSSEEVRAILDSDEVADLKKIKVGAKPGKIYIFDKKTEKAIYGE